MGKTSKRLKSRQAEFTSASLPTSKRVKTATAALAASASDAESAVDVSETVVPQSMILEDVVSQDELDLSMETLTALNQNPGLVKQKRLKELRRAIFTFSRIANGGNNASNASYLKSLPVTTSSLTARVSDSLKASEWTEARVLLSEMRIRKMTPKLGALQRWVRECDAISGISPTTTTVTAASSINGEEVKDTSGNHLAEKKEVMKVLDAILRVADPTVGSVDEEEDLSVIRHKDWDPRTREVASEPIYKSVQDGSIFSGAAATPNEKFKPILIIPGPDRKPPNLHPAILYSSNFDAVSLSQTPSTPITKTQHPDIPSVHLLHPILSPNECISIIRTCESIGFTPDAPTGTLGLHATSTLAHNVYWLTDLPFITTLCSRVQAHLQSITTSLPGSYGKLTGLNRRFRIYRYIPGALYRPHLDGAWPPSGTDPKTGSYVYDTSNNTQSSRLTFLIYLNDEFSGGQTTFFRPNKSRDGVLDAYGVKPVIGGALVFPHGNAEGALLHEGSGVGDGAKYIIRTDVLFEIA